MIEPRAILALGLLATALLQPQGAAAQDERAKARQPAPPLPLARPAKLGDPADAAVRPAQAPPARRAVVAIVETPHDLPVASRTRMHECGAQWQQMKMAGTAADKTWRVFAQSCLVSQAP